MEYSVRAYGRMIADRVRMDAYAAALAQVVTPDSVVLDIGTGTGIVALLAARLGARRVFAVDPSPVIEVARQAAQDNGFADRIEFFEASAADVELPEPADVAVADLRGVLPYYTLHLRVLDDARRRLLRPGGILIPQRDVLWAALAEAPAEIGGDLNVWREHARGFDLESARTLVANEYVKVVLGDTDMLLSEPNRIGLVDYSAGQDSDLSTSSTFTVLRPGTLHGFCVWFDTVLIDGVGFSNAPGTRGESIYGQGFFPISEEVVVAAGEEVRVELAANLIDDSYVYRWNVRVGPEGAPRARFRQSTFEAFPLSARALHAADQARTPSLSPDGWLVRRALELMDGTHTIAEVADALEVDDRSRTEALALATRLSQKYGA